MSFGIFRMRCIIAVKQKAEAIEQIIPLVKKLGECKLTYILKSVFLNS